MIGLLFKNVLVTMEVPLVDYDKDDEKVGVAQVQMKCNFMGYNKDGNLLMQPIAETIKD